MQFAGQLGFVVAVDLLTSQALLKLAQKTDRDAFGGGKGLLYQP